MVACLLDEFEHVFTFILSSFVIWVFTCVIHLFELLLHHFVGLYFSHLYLLIITLLLF